MGAELRRASIVVVAAAAAVALVGAGSFVFAPRTTDEHVYSGRMSPEFPIVVKNLTVGDGRYVIRYAMRVYVAPNPDSVGLVCGVVDTSGRIANLPGMARGVEPGSWVSLDAQGVFELPDLTVGIRCFAEQDATLQVIVRGAVLTATAAD